MQLQYDWDEKDGISITNVPKREKFTKEWYSGVVAPIIEDMIHLMGYHMQVRYYFLKDIKNFDSVDCTIISYNNYEYYNHESRFIACLEAEKIISSQRGDKSLNDS